VVSILLTKVDETQCQSDESSPFIAQGALQTLHQRLHNRDSDVAVGRPNKDETKRKSSVGCDLHRSVLIGYIWQELIGDVLSTRPDACKSDTDG
jgi:hypothetical protein